MRRIDSRLSKIGPTSLVCNIKALGYIKAIVRLQEPKRAVIEPSRAFIEPQGAVKALLRRN
jgi:hypothetical protein